MLKALTCLTYLIFTPLSEAALNNTFVLTSSAFKNGDVIPKTYTCHGDNISLPLQWSGIPRGTKSLALLMSDPDAVSSPPFYHWTIYNIPPSTTDFKTNMQQEAPMQMARNSFGYSKYQGPCPPYGEHRYFIRLYALDTIVPIHKKISALALHVLIHNHVIATAEIIGRSRAVIHALAR